MRKKCPPGVICIENVAFIIIFILIIIVLCYMYYKYKENNNNNICCNNPLTCNCKNMYNKNNRLNANDFNNNNNNNNNNKNDNNMKPHVGFSYNTNNNDVLLNPYSAPLRDDRIFNTNYNGPKIPINVPTQSFDTNYRQIGILTRVNGGETILPLMGRPLFSNRDKWNFYTMNDKNEMKSYCMSSKKIYIVLIQIFKIIFFVFLFCPISLFDFCSFRLFYTPLKYTNL